MPEIGNAHWNRLIQERKELERDRDRLRSALEGCLHFDDGFIKDDRIGEALRKWRAEARAALGLDAH